MPEYYPRCAVSSCSSKILCQLQIEQRDRDFTKFELADKIPALELLGKYLKLFTEKIEVSGIEGLTEAVAQARKRVGRI